MALSPDDARWKVALKGDTGLDLADCVSFLKAATSLDGWRGHAGAGYYSFSCQAGTASYAIQVSRQADGWHVFATASGARFRLVRYTARSDSPSMILAEVAESILLNQQAQRALSERPSAPPPSRGPAAVERNRALKQIEQFCDALKSEAAASIVQGRPETLRRFVGELQGLLHEVERELK